jgi:prolyl 4-hydroxylase
MKYNIAAYFIIIFVGISYAPPNNAEGFGAEDHIDCLPSGICVSKPVQNHRTIPVVTPVQNQEIESCEDRLTECSKFKDVGHCEKHPGWMIVNCPLSCDRCHLRDATVRCQRGFLNMSDVPIYGPGDFDRSMNNLSNILPKQVKVSYLSQDPYIVQLDNFISLSVADKLLSVVDHWDTPHDSRGLNAYGEAQMVPTRVRSGALFWCMNKCQNDPHVKKFHDQVAKVVQIPRENFEALQFVRHEENQGYKPTHDFANYHLNFPSGPRILTVHLFLNDLNEGGGELYFPDADVTITPKKGRVVIWPNTLLYNQLRVDNRMKHGSKAVIKGTKYAINAWAHLYDYIKPNHWGCTGSFESFGSGTSGSEK